jgi:hypothetical protein
LESNDSLTNQQAKFNLANSANYSKLHIRDKAEIILHNYAIEVLTGGDVSADVNHVSVSLKARYILSLFRTQYLTEFKVELLSEFTNYLLPRLIPGHTYTHLGQGHMNTLARTYFDLHLNHILYFERVLDITQQDIYAINRDIKEVKRIGIRDSRRKKREEDKK